MVSNQGSYILNYLGKQNHIVGFFNYHFGWFYGFALLHTMVFRYFKAATHDRSRDRGVARKLGGDSSNWLSHVVTIASPFPIPISSLVRSSSRSSYSPMMLVSYRHIFCSLTRHRYRPDPQGFGENF